MTAIPPFTAPALAPCPVAWCERPQPHPFEPVGVSWDRMHRRAVDAKGRVSLALYELVEGGQPASWEEPGDAGRVFLDVDVNGPFDDGLVSGEDGGTVALSLADGATLALALADGVTLAVDLGVDERSPAIELVGAEREVLAAVQEFASGRVGQDAVLGAFERLTLARAGHQNARRP